MFSWQTISLFITCAMDSRANDLARSTKRDWWYYAASL
ncbi:hypothetical protein MRB53_002909 [Persea americana]|uniref:Uncharacterized protein n=1 Tax=Persea americana TaxID=3435 RepID=A0ACC2MVT1_PERAE|nr:hypothetical protein MRB53_002909 [Persea americana]